MWTRASRFSPLGAALIATLVACADEPQAPTPVPPLFSHAGNHSISGTVLGPDNTSICNFMPASGRLRVRLINYPAGTLAAVQVVTCPADTYSISVSPGSYLVRVSVFDVADAPTLATIPLAEIDLNPIVVDGGDVVRDFQVVEGLPLLGQATLDGQPLGGYGLEFRQVAAPMFLAGATTSGADGLWTDAFLGRPVMTLQGGVTYNVRSSPAFVGAPTCGLLGARTVVAPPASFAFSVANQRVDCTLETGATLPFTHTRTRLVVTPGPGEIGGLGETSSACKPLPGDPGQGFGVQFPVASSGTPPLEPMPASHLFCGGLLIGVAPNVVLSAVDLGGYLLDCGGACRDLGFDGELSFEDDGPRGKKVTWSYTDASSPERVGLRVIQRSFDGRPPADYVLFRFSLRNLGRSPRTLHVGFVGDWDVDNDALDDVGVTELGGRLMYMTSTNPNDRGILVGTLFLGDAPIAGTLFFNNSNIPQSLAAQMDALSGAVTRQTIGPADNRVIHAVGPIALAPRGTADVWMAVVAGETLTQLLANAAAAAADVRDRR